MRAVVYDGTRRVSVHEVEDAALQEPTDALVRITSSALCGTDLHMYGTLWLLTQGETRNTKRVRLFTEFVSRRLAAYAPLLAGLSISRD